MTYCNPAEKFFMCNLLGLMKNGKMGIIDYFFPFFPSPETVINILRRIKNPLVQISDFIKQLASKEPACGNCAIHFSYIRKWETIVNIVFPHSEFKQNFRNS